MKKAILFCVVAVVCVNANNDFRIIDSITYEPECIQKGGICTISEDCPEGKLVEERGLCPKQRSQGIECCYGQSIKETRCSMHGGMCMPLTVRWNPNLVYEGASDCESDQKCCILVH